MYERVRSNNKIFTHYVPLEKNLIDQPKTKKWQFKIISKKIFNINTTKLNKNNKKI